MNLKYWDRHKTVAIITAIALIMFIIFANIQRDMENNASKRATNLITKSEIDAVLKYHDYYEKALNVNHGFVDTMGTVFYYVVLFGALHSAWTALDIPERYQKPKETSSQSESSIPSNEKEKS